MSPALSRSPPVQPFSLAGLASAGENVRTPDAKAVPQLPNAKITLVQGIKQVEAKYGPAIEAKFELDDEGALSLSVYPAAKGLKNDAEFNVFEEASGPAAASPVEAVDRGLQGPRAPDALRLRPHADAAEQDQPRDRRPASTRQAARDRVLGDPVPAGKKPAIGVYIRSSDGKSHRLVIPRSWSGDHLRPGRGAHGALARGGCLHCGLGADSLGRGLSMMGSRRLQVASWHPLAARGLWLVVLSCFFSMRRCGGVTGWTCRTGGFPAATERLAGLHFDHVAVSPVSRRR